MKSNILRNSSIVALLAVLFSATVMAEEPVPDQFRLAIGGFNTNRIESTLSLTGADAGVGASISPRDTLGLEVESTVLRIEGHYRFNQEHALTYGWYNISADGNKDVSEEFEWVDEDGNTITVPIGANVNTLLETEIFKLGYLWSFYRSDKLELSVGGGLHTTRLTVGLDASITNPPNSSVENVDSTLPLPVISFALNYQVTPKFGWYVKAEAFALAFDNYSGSYRDSLVGAEYRFWRQVGLGAAISFNSLNLQEDDAEAKLRYQNSITGAMVYLATYF
jgi:hypothetical protein